jgi:hypothetical protein
MRYADYQLIRIATDRGVCRAGAQTRDFELGDRRRKT